MLWDDVGATSEEMRKVIPVVKENGGCIFSSHHLAPSSVSLADFRHIVELAKELRAY